MVVVSQFSVIAIRVDYHPFGVGILLFAASGVVYHLKISLNAIWRTKLDPEVKIKKVIIDRVLSFAFILAIGFLLLISFIVTAAISILNDTIREVLPDVLLYAAYTIDFLIRRCADTLKKPN
ncbi:YhjD/YihY/BrkB family envelope integrity protein [Arenibacter palladensis]|uniref:YhjD/YihY/BrkB family envelope integrity protein n=1 Tax=Arenibacter palladensis TaxID=237373 RepID=UPI002FCE6E4A